MARINTMNAWLFGFISVFLKILGISETVFEVTQKYQSSNDGGYEGRFTFDASPIFVPGTTVLLLQLWALVVGFRDMPPSVNNGSGLGEILCSILVVTCLWPFMKGLLAKGKYGIPLSTICKSALLALSFVHLHDDSIKSVVTGYLKNPNVTLTDKPHYHHCIKELHILRLHGKDIDRD
ncbi:unnamed protein product [Dovyalis caffra]|uniref:Uncharacterized protein n=1 Tax=Dovyalis caffra TaxID=77055 RepID=A0AAV1SCK0_9ROSI|nr:unnamed protein product [Dovyalis caffra]